MDRIELSKNIQSSLQSLLQKYPLITQAVALIIKEHGRAYLVGGAVRDLFLNLPVHDMDIEVHNLSLDQLEKILSTIAPVSYVGKSFGILKMHNLPIDWSLPRIDEAGRKPKVALLPSMGIEAALRRRDLTMNAMAIDLQTHELIDPFNGRHDMQQKMLRSPDILFFIEDPLRFFRVMQFIGRFEMVPDESLNGMCATMDISTVSIERKEVEFDKLLLKSKRPSLGFRWLHTINRLREVLPELADTVGIPQDPLWHPEGDVFEHSMQSIDAAAALSYQNAEEKLICLYAALCHDLGKAVTTALVKGRLHSYGHEQASGVLAQELLSRIITRKKLIACVVALVKVHMRPGAFINQNATPAAYKRLALKLAPDVTLALLSKLAIADFRGRNPHGHTPLTGAMPHVEEFIKRAQMSQVLEHAEQPLLLGRDIADIVEPGPEMGKLLKTAYKIQLEKGIQDKEQLKELVKQLVPKRPSKF